MALATVPLTAQTTTLPDPMPPADARTANAVDGLALPADLTVGSDEGFVELEAATAGQVRFAVLGQVPVKFKATGKSVIVATPARGGTVLVLAVAVINGQLTDFARCTVTITPAVPVAPPGPPTPPSPNVISGKAYITLVQDAQATTPAQAAVLGSPALRRLAQARGALRVVDKSDPWLATKKLDGFLAQAGGLPAILVQNEQGVVVLAKPLPATEAEAVALLKGVLDP